MNMRMSSLASDLGCGLLACSICNRFGETPCGESPRIEQLNSHQQLFPLGSIFTGWNHYRILPRQAGKCGGIQASEGALKGDCDA
jgi:hypothetical protein